MKAGLILVAAAWFAQASFAQTPGASVSGTIFDERGGPVIAARLELHGDGSQLYRSRSSEQGTFRFGRMEAGTYTLSIDQAGFCKMEIKAIAVKAGEQKALPRVILRVPGEKGDCG